MNQTKSSTTKGIISVICAGFFFALMTFFVRLSGDLPTMEKAFFRNAVAALVSLSLIYIQRCRRSYLMLSPSCVCHASDTLVAASVSIA